MNYYHVYNRGAHKAEIFPEAGDYQRFLYLLYLANNTERFRFSRLAVDKIFSHPRKDVYVDIVAYCLMPNHYHIVMREMVENGISLFMHKISSAYTMYYNVKYNHSGTIFQGQYKSKHVDNDDYFRYLIQYVHLNPFGIQEPNVMNIAKSEYLEEATAYSKKYVYSSYKDYLREDRVQKVILSRVDLASVARSTLDHVL